MPYLYRCDECGEEHHIDLRSRWKDPMVICNGCTKKVCVTCVNRGEFCDDCVERMKEERE
jgi:predicted nucleic acid-binding Zn ribbon protein